MIYIGTSGFSYKDWVGPYYPHDLPKSEWLAFYGREFSTCEINFTYYRLPNAWTLERMADKTPDGFLFTVKANKDMTHVREDNKEVFGKFVDALRPLLDRGKFGCVLAQFPYSFHNTVESREYLVAFRERIGDLPVVVEFRNREWIKPAIFELLQENNLGFCCVDQPRFKNLIPPIAEVTSAVAYVRFHGRNAAKWWKHEEAWERYDYTYSDEELQEWVPKIQGLEEKADQTFIFTNNHWRGQAVDAARQLKMLLQQ
ncbi:MAG: DUF72 domain-containing protein [Anaerolineae bacterium]